MRVASKSLKSSAATPRACIATATSADAKRPSSPGAVSRVIIVSPRRRIGFRWCAAATALLILYHNPFNKLAWRRLSLLSLYTTTPRTSGAACRRRHYFQYFSRVFIKHKQKTHTAAAAAVSRGLVKLNKNTITKIRTRAAVFSSDGATGKNRITRRKSKERNNIQCIRTLSLMKEKVIIIIIMIKEEEKRGKRRIIIIIECP